MKLLVAGASGMLGRLVVAELLWCSEQFRTLSRKPLLKNYAGSVAIEHAIGEIRKNERQIAVGGPELFTRKELVELAFSATRRILSIYSIPRPLFLMMAWPIKLLNPRIHALLEFCAAVSTADAIVPMYGKRRLNDYFSSLIERRTL